jgi:hypothetical protein
MAEPSVEPSLISNLPLPSGMVLPPIVDPDGPGPPYGRGEAVELGAVVIVYEGTSTTSDGYVAAFQIMGDLPQSVSGLFFLPGGPSVPLAVDGDRATSEPFHLRGTPQPTTLFSWRVGSDTVVWELGPIESR